MRTLFLAVLISIVGCSARTGGNAGGDAGDDGGGGGDDAPSTFDAAACATGTQQVVAAPVDIIIDIDQSASMGEEITGVVDNINTNLAAILTASNLDWRVILVAGALCIQPPLGAATTAPGCYASNLPRYTHIDFAVNSSDALTAFLWAYDGNGKQANTCIKTTLPNKYKDSLRFDAHKFFIAITDDDPISFNAAAAGRNLTTATNSDFTANFQCPTYADSAATGRGAEWKLGPLASDPFAGSFPEELYKLQPAGMFGTPTNRKWTFHSIIGLNSGAGLPVLGPTAPIVALGSVCSFTKPGGGVNTGETSGVEYQKLSRLTGGLRFPSCNTNYSPVYQAIANTITPLACVFDVSSTSLGQIDPTKTNVTFDKMDGTGPKIIPRDDTAPCDAGANGWQWVDATYTKLKLCGQACADVKATANGKVAITVGCTTVIL